METGRSDNRLPPVRPMDVVVYRQTRLHFSGTCRPADRCVDRQWLGNQIPSALTGLHKSRRGRDRLGNRRRSLSVDLGVGWYRSAGDELWANKPDFKASGVGGGAPSTTEAPTISATSTPAPSPS